MFSEHEGSGKWRLRRVPGSGKMQETVLDQRVGSGVGSWTRSGTLAIFDRGFGLALHSCHFLNSDSCTIYARMSPFLESTAVFRGGKADSLSSGAMMFDTEAHQSARQEPDPGPSGTVSSQHL